MSEKQLYKSAPKHWDISRSYLILKKIVSKLTNGTAITRFEVVNRKTCVGFEKNWICTDSLKGVDYMSNELQKIQPYAY